MKSTLSAAGVYIAILLLTIGFLEALSAAVLYVWPLIRSESEVRPTKYTDAMIARLYGGNVTKYRKVIEESWRKIPPRYEPLVEHIETPFHGEYVNVTASGYRITPGQIRLDSNSSNRRLFMFGGSTTFGYGVADDETIPAFLQTALLNSGIDDVAVFNFGQGGYYSSLERIRFLRLITDGWQPDIAVFLDGLNEFNDVRFPDRSSNSDRLAFLANRPILAAISESSTATLAAKVARRQHGDLSDRRIADNAILQKMVDRLAINREVIRAICKSLRIQCLFVQQPVPFFGFDESSRAVPLSATHLSMIGDLSARVNKGFQIMRDDPRYVNSDLLWLTDLKTRENMYIDAFHYSPAMNAAIARVICERLLGAR
jgi:hypothetical protein